MISILANDYSGYCEINLDLGILKINVEYTVLPSSKRVRNQIQKISSREGSVTQDIRRSAVQRKDIWKKQLWRALPKEYGTK